MYRLNADVLFFYPMLAHQQIGKLFAHAATGFAITDVDGSVLHANQTLATLVDRSPAEMPNLNLFDLIHAEDRSQHRTQLRKLLTGEIPGFVIEKRYLRPDGTPVWVRNSVSLANDGQENELRLMSISEDISTYKRAKEVLEQQEQLAAMGRLTSSIIHEINNPLEAVLNLLYLAQHAPDLDEARPYLKNAEEELGRAAEITAQGLQFHRQPSSVVATNVVEIMQTVLTLFKARLRIAQVKVNLVTDTSAELMCFPGEVRQIFVNLIGNAVESMPKGGRLRIRVRPGTDWRTGDRGVRITIADTGSGISPETRKHMYEAFFTTKGAGGSGLGLWVTANIVRKHQGNMLVRSKGQPGSGTVFLLVFPQSGADGKKAGFQDAA